MKPLKLVMSAFGPFRGKEEIQFEKLGQDGLFLVTGDTGAGKTTIFDAVSFALYGNASGENRTADCFRSDYAEQGEKTFVELIFLHKGKEYHIIRNPMYRRKKLRGEGITEEKANATLILYDGSVVSGYQPVTEAVITLLGIDWKQFKQIVMIAQGEFLQMLTANSSERGIIFRKVFGTQIYDELQRRLKGKANAFRNQCEEMDKSILQFLNGIQCEKGNVHYEAIMQWKESKEIHQIDAALTVLEELIAMDRKQYVQVDRAIEMISKKMEEKTRTIANGERINELIQNKETAIAQFQTLMAREEEMRKKGALIQLSKRALYTVKPAEDRYLYQKRQAEELKKVIEKQTKEVDALQKKWEEITNTHAEKVKTKPQIKELEQKIGRQETELQQYDVLKKLEEEEREIHNRKQMLQGQLEDLMQQKKDLSEEGQAKKQEFCQYKELDFAFLECWKKLQDQTALIEKYKQWGENYNLFIAEEKILEDHQNAYQEAEQRYQHQNQLYMEKEVLFLREQAGVLASNLSEGDPCPVCGSKEHPKKAKMMEEAPSEKELEQERLKRDQEHQIWVEAGNRSKSQKANVQFLQEHLIRMGKDLFEIKDTEDINIIKKVYHSLFKTEKNQLSKLQKEEESLQSKRKKRDRYETRLNEIEELTLKVDERIESIKKDCNEAENSFSELSGQLKTTRESVAFATKEEAENALCNMRRVYESLQEELKLAEDNVHSHELKLGNLSTLLSDNHKKLKAKKAELLDAKTLFMEALVQSSFSSKENYHSTLMSQEDLEKLIDIVDDYQSEYVLLSKRIEDLEQSTKDVKEVDVVQLKEEYKQLEENRIQENDQRQRIYSRLETNEIIDREIKEKLVEQDKIRQEFLMINDLAKTANGELSGKAKIAFEQYVQAFYFDRVIMEANKRLYVMSNQQYILRRKEDASNLRSLTGLELEVMDFYTGKARAIKSLSGGESFKASLALALGMSDMIQSFAGGIEVDAMFIDEGFGSLDSASLDQAIDTLYALTKGSRLVGIISHVSELRERIDKKISIEKSMEGSKVTLMI